MARSNAPIYSLNGGAVSPLALTRADLPKLTICSEFEENWAISTLGHRSIRPGTTDLGQTQSNNPVEMVRFVGTASTCSLIELTPNSLRVRNDGEIVTRGAVSTVVDNGDFSQGGDGLAGWTLDVPLGGGIEVINNRAQLRGTGIGKAAITRKLDVANPDRNKEHALRITVVRGPIKFSIGTAAYLQDVAVSTDLGAGQHSLAFVPTADVWITFTTSHRVDRIVGPIEIEAAGIMTLPTPWTEEDLPFVRDTQQGDVVFVACRGVKPMKIESRSRRSWSVVDYLFEKGPYRAREEAPTSISAPARLGVLTFTAGQPIFNAGQVGALFELTHAGQRSEQDLTGEGQFCEPVRIVGVEADRDFFWRVVITGPGSTKVTFQRALGSPDLWVDTEFEERPFVTAADTPIEYTSRCPLDNAIVYYRMGIKTGDYDPGDTAHVKLTYDGGTTATSIRIVDYISPTQVRAEVPTFLPNLDGTTLWREGAWSEFRGYPRDVGFQDGRIWFLDKNLVNGSVSDDFPNFDDATEGDSAPIIRSIATGPADGNVWMMMLYRMFIASSVAVNQIRVSSLDEPVTSKQFGVRLVDDVGAADIAPSVIGSRGVFAGRSGIDLYEIGFTGSVGDFGISLLSRLNPDILKPGLIKIVAQRRPEPRLWCILGDGTAAILTYNRDEEVIAWTLFTTDGFLEDVCVLPGLSEDDVYLCVNRFMNGGFTRRIERVAYEANTKGDDVNEIGDCGVHLSNDTPRTTWGGLGFYNGKTVVAWADGKGYEGLTVSGGSVTLPEAVRDLWIALPYSAPFKSTKLAYAAEGGTALGQRKRVDHLGLFARSTARIGLRFGPSRARLSDMPTMVEGKEVDPRLVENEIDDISMTFDGGWNSDPRFHLEARAPWPCCLQAAVLTVTTHDAR